MEDKNSNLASMSSLFNNKTLSYRINGFAHACKMENVAVTQNGGVLFTSKKDKKSAEYPDYYITANTHDGDPRGVGVVFSGYYRDLNFVFTNFCDFKTNLNHKIKELPFSIVLIKTIDKETYRLQIETIKDVETKFIINKSREYKDKTINSNVTFYANVLDFSQVLKLVKAFVYNPVLVFETYNGIKNNKKTVFTNNDLNKGIMQDEKLDKPTGKLKKKIKSIIG